MLLTVVIPVYNEADVLPLLLAALRRVLAGLDCSWEILFVNDGSTDSTGAILGQAAAEDRRFRVIEFTRNFGHQAAVTAGVDFAGGDAVVVMDADLQDPPELLPEMLRLIRQGFDVVSAQRVSRARDGWLKRRTAEWFYWFMRRMVDPRLASEVADFRMFSRRAVDAIRQFREQHRFMRGLVAWLGLKEITVPFDRPARAAGQTKYPLLKMVRFAWTAISSFSALPLRLSVGAGFATAFFGLVYSLHTVYLAVVRKVTVPGWTSLVCLQFIFSGATLIAIGLVGEYIARIYEELKSRPLYVVARTVNLGFPAVAPDKALVISEEQPAAQAAPAAR